MAAIGSAKKIGVNTYSGSLKKKNRDTTMLYIIMPLSRSYASTVPIYAYIKLKDDQTAKHVSQFSKNKKGKPVGSGSIRSSLGRWRREKRVNSLPSYM
ncbi:hypothetical protein POVCU2_0000840 [Plasmodium ovale curtisi]|uniref:Uncharacterized protein n=1 Tax=Plasmodium ovale curtisi TaxID=864141 RepID=A0A1A8VHM0_PLAOA|nr:hypothetical protein POVCU2_0000840 [Plasmodium ovale curtisi]SBS80425.1 hypothetical protein POVCU1_000880 [Plasmodium ovale curtisi]